MHPAMIRHVLAQELHADVHKFQRIQCASACFRLAARMGRNAVETVYDLIIGQGKIRLHVRRRRRMPGDRRIEFVERAVSRHK